MLEKRAVDDCVSNSGECSQGIAGWMLAWTLVSPEPEVAERGEIVESLPGPQHEVVSVLAGMALGCLAEVA